MAQEKTAKAVKESHPSGKVGATIGGAPVTQTFPDSVGGDNCGRDATAVVPLARQFLWDA